MRAIKERIDTLLVKKGLFTSRQKAQYAIEQRQITIQGTIIEKANTLVEEDATIEIKGDTLPYVSRGGLKLEKAIQVFQIPLQDKTCMDIGASTGGFTDCMLQKGAKKVYAIDVGHDQLVESLKQNPKVISKEGTNIKDLSEQEVEAIDFIGTDVSFISLTQVLPKIYEFLKITGKAVVLIKPQFEAGKINVNKNGVVKDSKVHYKVLQNILLFSHTLGFKILGIDYSPIKGPAGNIEYLLYLEKNQNTSLDKFEYQEIIHRLVDNAFKDLKERR